jgi:hypothetical protein
MSWASNFVRFGSLIFVLPLVLTVYDDLEQALWFLTSTIIGFAMLADSGFGSVLVRAVAYFKAGADSIPKTKEEYDNKPELENAEPNMPKLVDLLTTSNRIYLLLNGLVVVMLLTAGTAFVWNIMELSGHRTDFWIAFGLLIPYSVITVASVKWISFMRGLNFVALTARLSTILSVIRIFLFVVLLSFSLEPAWLIGAMVLEAIVKNWYLKRITLKWIRGNKGVIENAYYFDKPIFWSIWPATWKLGGIFWGNYLVESGNSILIAQISDTRLMSSFLFTTRIVSFVRNIAQTPFYANIPTIYRLGAQKKLHELRKKSSEYIFLGLILMFFACVFIAALGNFSLEFIKTETRFLELKYLFIMCLVVLLDMHSSFHASIYTSTNHIPFLIPSVLSGALIVGVGFYILPMYGLMGILLVRFFVQISFNNWYAQYLSLKLLNWPWLKYSWEMPKSGSQYVYAKVKEFNPWIYVKSKLSWKN